MLVNEIFFSIQGESTYAGLPCVFIRMAGCNLECSWCDTPYARTTEGAREMSEDEIVSKAFEWQCSLVEITGGEPLKQDGVKELCSRFLEDGRTVLVETNGSVSLEGLDERVVKIVDVKCPSSGHAGSFLMANLGFIAPGDELKFVVAHREDYEYAKRFMEECLRGRTAKVLFAPVEPDMNPRVLAEWILKDALTVRLQLQIHKYVWNGEKGK